MTINDLLPIALLVVFVWNVILTLLYSKLSRHYNTFTKNTKQKDLLTSLNNLLKNTKQNETGISDLNNRLDQEIKKSRKNFKKIGFKRYNPFTDTGGDQSFVLALLDENNDGFVISSLHSRENTRLYAKSIKAGSSIDQVLSKEEKEILKKIS